MSCCVCGLGSTAGRLAVYECGWDSNGIVVVICENVVLVVMMVG